MLGVSTRSTIRQTKCNASCAPSFRCVARGVDDAGDVSFSLRNCRRIINVGQIKNHCECIIDFLMGDHEIKLASFVDIVNTELLQYAPFLWANMASSEKTHAGLLTFLESTQKIWGNNSWSC